MPSYVEISRACDGSQEKGQYRHGNGQCKDPTGHLHISGNCLQRVWRLVAKLTICSLYLHSTTSCIQFDRTAIQAVLNALRLEEVNAQAATWRPEQQFSRGSTGTRSQIKFITSAASHIITFILRSTSTKQLFVKEQSVAREAFEWCDMVLGSHLSSELRTEKYIVSKEHLSFLWHSRWVGNQNDAIPSLVNGSEA